MIEKQEQLIKDVFKKLSYDEGLAIVSVSSRPELCDYQVNSVFKLAKELKENPVTIGEKIVEEINKHDDFSKYFKEVTFVKPGFINITISDELINSELNNVRKFGNIKKIDEEKTVILDYGGANMAKPLHVGHLRTAIIGQSAYEILKKKGYNVISDVHFGDMGLQIGEVLYGVIESGLSIEEVTMEHLNKIYPNISKRIKTDEELLEKCWVITNKLQKLLLDSTLEDPENYLGYYNKIYKLSFEDIKNLYGFMGVSFDLWYGEKDSLKYMKPVMELFTKENLVEDDNGCKIVRVAKDSDNKTVPPAMLELKSGAQGYQASDIATIYGRVEENHPDYIYYFVDVRQSLHFEQVFRACSLAGLTDGITLEHCYNGTINGSDGKPFKTRSGDTVKLVDLFKDIKEAFLSKKESNKDMSKVDIDKITRAIINFAELSNNREKDYIFDINKFSDVQGKTGPYILYTALRIRKILRENKFNNAKISDKIYNEYDRDLRMKLLEVDHIVTKSANEKMPHYVAEYLYDLCVISNTFYQNNNINSLEDEKNKEDWLNLLDFTYKTIEELLELLMIEIPSEM